MKNANICVIKNAENELLRLAQLIYLQNCRNKDLLSVRRDCMNEGMTIFLNMDERKTDENEALIKRIDELLLNFGI